MKVRLVRVWQGLRKGVVLDTDAGTATGLIASGIAVPVKALTLPECDKMMRSKKMKDKRR